MKYQYCQLFLLCAMLMIFAQAVHGQTALDIEQLLDAKKVTCSQAAYFVLAAVSEDPPQSPEAAFALAYQNGWLPVKAESGGDMTFNSLSLFLMKAFNQRMEQTGSLMYRLFPVSRYAYRTMVSQGFIEGRVYPGQNVSGGQFLRILEKILAEDETE